MQKLTSNVHHLQIPFEPDAERGWKPCPIFHGVTSGNWILECHVSALQRGVSPHPPHRHQEEEILLVLAGEIDLILPDRPPSQGGDRQQLRRGQFVYYPAGHAHTLTARSEQPANYLMLKWYARPTQDKPHMQFGVFHPNKALSKVDPDTGIGLDTIRIFEERTEYLRKLHCHASCLAPFSGYAAHIDPYDVVIIALEGELETLDEKFAADSLVYYAAGEPHGMKNPGSKAARYLVFEFHGNQMGFGDRCRIGIHSLFIRLTEPRSLIRGLGRFFKRHYRG